jgi:hypothetical protein
VLWFGIVPLVDSVLVKIYARVFVVAHIACPTLAILMKRGHLPRVVSERAHA